MQIVNKALYNYLEPLIDKHNAISVSKVKQITEEEFLNKFLPATMVILSYKKSYYKWGINIYIATEKDKKENDDNDIWVYYNHLIEMCIKYCLKSDTLFKEIEQKFSTIIDQAVVDNTIRNNILKQKLSPYIRKVIENKYKQTIKNGQHLNHKTLLLMRKNNSCNLTLIWKDPPTISDLELLFNKNIRKLEEIVKNPTTKPELLKAIYHIAKDDKYMWLRLRVLNNPNCSREFIEDIFNTTNNAQEFKAILENPLVKECKIDEIKEVEAKNTPS